MSDPQQRVLGIIGGVGPQAGARFFNLFTAQSSKVARSDQQHFSVVLVSLPALIPDRSAWLATGRGPNPAEGLFAAAQRAVAAGADALIIPCNTAHADRIFEPLRQSLAERYPQLELWHWVDCTLAALASFDTVAVLATEGSYAEQLYPKRSRRSGFRIKLAEPDDEGRKMVHQAIYHPDHGLKSCGQVSEEALSLLGQAAMGLHQRQPPQALLLACTELSLAKEELSAYLRQRGSECCVVDGSELVAAELVRRLTAERRDGGKQV